VVGFRWSAVLLLALMLTGCAGQDRFSESPDESESAERAFGFIQDVDAEARTIRFDPAEWLTGDEARQAAVADGKGQPGEPVPDDYYIRNPDRRLLVLRVAPDARIRGATPVTFLRSRPPCTSCTAFPVSVAQFFAAFGPHGAAQGAYWVTTRGRRVVAIEEQYRP
jgi:hypothetical protein